MILVKLPNLLKLLSVGLISVALDQPVDSRVKQALILIIWKLIMASLHDVVIQLEHVLDHEQQVVLVRRIQLISNSGQIGTCVRGTEWLSDASNHLGQTDQVRLMHAPLHVLLEAEHGQLKVNAREHLTDAAHFVKPVATDFLDLVRNLSEVSRVLVLISDDDPVVGVDLGQLAHAATDKL